MSEENEEQSTEQTEQTEESKPAEQVESAETEKNQTEESVKEESSKDQPTEPPKEQPPAEPAPEPSKPQPKEQSKFIEPKKEEEDAKSYLTPTYFYDDKKLFSESIGHTQFDETYEIFHIYGIDLTHRYNAIPLNETTLIVTAGNYSFFLDLVTGSEQIIPGHNNIIGCCAVHPNGQYVALGEGGENPQILIYHFPTLKLYRILRNGTEAAFTALNFSPDGTMLACVGNFPDYTLTIWDWEKENLILRSKAFSQEIFRVTFSEKLQGHLVTSGVGHIRFWEMARTFTGLKLQGEIGKFGNIEISDTSGYAMFDDGKVLSGSESGTLLLWQDAFVKCEFVRAGGKKCHKGMVEVVFHKGHDIISAGRDGVIRTWDYQTIDTAETDDTTVPIDLTMKTKLRIAKGASIRCMYPLGSEYLVVDASNGLWRADLENKRVQIIQKFHAGPIRAISFSPNSPLFVTGGDDGYIRLWDIPNKMLLSELKFEAGVTRLFWAPLDLDPDGVSIYAGFSDGCLRVILAGKNGLVLKQPLKPHTAPVRDIVQAVGAKMLATTGDDGALFFFRVDGDLKPAGFTYVNGRKPLTKEQITQSAITGEPIKDDRVYARGIRIRWGEVVSVECDDGTVSSVTPPASFPDENSESFYLNIPVEILKSGGFDENITSLVSLEEGEVMGNKEGFVIFSEMKKKIFDSAVTSLGFSPDSSFFGAGSETGELFIFKQKDSRIRSIQSVELKDVEVPEKVEDIKQGDYSIEEEKQKSELDRRIKAADQTKDLKKQRIEELRKQFSNLFQQNLKAPSYLRLDSSAFKIDPFMYDLQEENSKKLEKEASVSTMWEAEKSRVALRKVRARLLKDMEEESFTVSSIDNPIKVSSFRMSKLDPEAEEIFKETEQLSNRGEGADEEGSENPSNSAENDPSNLNDNGSSNASTAELGQTTQTIISSPKGKASPGRSIRGRFNRFNQQAPMKKIIHTPDEHTKMRQKRDERKRAIMEQKPPANYSDPADVEAIEIARKTIGDYKLKDDPTYIAPEEDRMNAEKKRKQLMLLQKAIQDLKIDFNDKLKNLSELKSKLVKSIDNANRELEQISMTIGNDPNVVERIRYHLDTEEPLVLSDKIEIVLPTPDAVSFAEKVAAAAKRRIEVQAGKQKQAQAPQRRGAGGRKQQTTQKKKVDNKPKLTEIEQMEENEMKARLSFKRERIIKKIKESIQKFDQKVEEISREKISINSEVELAELRLVMMLREYKLLSKLEMKDHELNEKLKQREKEMNEIDSEVLTQEKNLKHQEHTIEESQKQLKKYQKQFEQMVDSTYKFHDHLAKLYSYNIRRNAKKNEGDEIEVDIANLDVEAVKKMFEAQSIDKEEDVCPSGCDPQLFEKVLDLREQKMDIVERINEANSQKEQITKQCNSILHKKKGLKAQYEQIKNEFTEFQHEKQRHLNELNFSLSLQFHQIQNLQEERTVDRDGKTVVTKSMPQDLPNSLVFLKSGLKKLAQQEQNLKAERSMFSEMLKNENANYKKDIKDKDQIDKELGERAKKLEEIQKLKFGQPVDLVVLEQMRVNQEADQLKTQIKSVEKTQSSEMKEIEEEINQQTELLTAEIQRNTAVLDSLADLTQQQRNIETVLQNSRGTQSNDDMNQDLGLQDSKRLYDEIERNNQLIEKLNEEKELLKKK